jgi:uncharacterized phage protein gp47/JayE
MSGPYPLATLAPTVTSAGITIPAYADVLASLQASYRNIYGQDVDLAADTQDGQWIAIQAQAISDLNDAIVGAYNGYSPTYAQGVQLSSQVKLNGLRRESAGNSQAPVNLVGVAGTLIVAGILSDDFGNDWALPPNITIPLGGAIVVTMTCQTPGAVILESGSTTVGSNGGLSFVTVVANWQSATTTAAATQGEAVETDAALRQRQSVSTSLPAQTPLQSILAAVANLPNVGRYAIYENDTASPDANGLTPHTIAVVVEGGSATTIAQTIELYKNPGTGTYGSTQEVVQDPTGVPDVVNFFFLTEVQVYFAVALTPLTGFVATTAGVVLNAIAYAIGSLPVGQNVGYSRVVAAANLSGTAAVASSGLTQAQLDALATTFEVASLYLGLTLNPSSGESDLVILFYQAAECPTANGTVTT